jgi:malonate-semialdehyde dehydrogenase (acetylating)/methylmalonate-semialdehyde dehydrogenase
MAISVALFVGSAQAWIPDVAQAMSEVRPGAWDDNGAGYGPQISPQAKARILEYIEKGKLEGANCLLDGSDCTVEGLPDGNWIGPTLFSDVSPKMTIYTDEIFGPVLVAVNADTLEEAISLINDNPFGNGTSIFTSSGGAARRFQSEIEVGQVGINIPIPVPLPFFSFTGWKNSFYGDQHAYGKQAIRFYTETKTITARWFSSDAVASANMTIDLK